MLFSLIYAIYVELFMTDESFIRIQDLQYFKAHRKENFQRDLIKHKIREVGN